MELIRLIRSLSIDKSLKPVEQPLRIIPFALEVNVESKLGMAVRQNIIEAVVGPSPYIFPVVIVFA